MKSRRFLSGSPNHVYQRSLTGSVMFYSLEDCLVYFTVFCTCAKRYGVTVLGLCLMYDHIHQLVETPDLPSLSGFERLVNLKFSYEYYDDLRQGSGELMRKTDALPEKEVPFHFGSGVREDSPRVTAIPGTGHLLRSPYGSAPKVGGKAVRTCIAYINNNPVERHIHTEAIKWRWNFLAYAFSDHPFSGKLVRRAASHNLRRHLKEVEGSHSRGTHLRYSQLYRMFSGLSAEERSQLVDFMIVTYNVIDHSRLTSLYGSPEKMLLAINSNTGSEYDIREERHRNPDTSYGQMMNYVIRNEYVRRAKDVLLLPSGTKDILKTLLVRDTLADEWQARKFLGLPLPERKR